MLKQANEICLFCNLYDLFTKYSINEIEAATPGGNDIDRVLQPRQVRQALSQLNFDTIGGQDFQEGNMGCAQETFEKIMNFLHREYVDPNYLVSFCRATRGEDRWQMGNRLDEMGCTPHCAAHSVFGI